MFDDTRGYPKGGDPTPLGWRIRLISLAHPGPISQSPWSTGAWMCLAYGIIWDFLLPCLQSGWSSSTESPGLMQPVLNGMACWIHPQLYSHDAVFPFKWAIQISLVIGDQYHNRDVMLWLCYDCAIYSKILFRLLWLCEHCFFSHRFRIIIPIDFHIFQRGRSTTNQLCAFLGITSGSETAVAHQLEAPADSDRLRRARWSGAQLQTCFHDVSTMFPRCFHDVPKSKGRCDIKVVGAYKRCLCYFLIIFGMLLMLFYLDKFGMMNT